MSEYIEEQGANPTSADPERYFDLIRRRHVPFLLALLFGWVVVWGASWVLPARYKSTTLILVQQPSMPKDYVTPNVSDNLQDRLASITQQILSRTRLLTIIEKLNLYQGGKVHLTPDDQVALMRKDIDIELVRDASDRISAFRVNFSSPDPRTAQNVTRLLTELFINENLKTRQQESEDTTNFIKNQLEDARNTLAQQEAKVRAFETQHEGELPTQQATNLQILAGLQSQLQNEQDALNSARQQRAYYEALLGQYNNQVGTAHPTSDSLQMVSPTATIDQQLDALQAKLANLRSRYTEQYPDVVATKDEIAKLEAMRQNALSNTKSKTDGKGGNSSVSTAASSVLSPVAQVRGQIEANRLEISNREQTIAGLKTRINDYQARLNAVPATQQQLADLTRGYDQSKQNYDDLLKKESDSEMATNMEQMQQGERFTMLDPPSLPVKPDFPNRLKFCGIGLAAGLGLGVLLIGALEFFDKRLYSEKEIRALLPAPLIAAIPEIQSAADLKQERGKMVLGWTIAAVVILIIAAGSAYSYLRA